MVCCYPAPSDLECWISGLAISQLSLAKNGYNGSHLHLQASEGQILPTNFAFSPTVTEKEPGHVPRVFQAFLDHLVTCLSMIWGSTLSWNSGGPACSTWWHLSTKSLSERKVELNSVGSWSVDIWSRAESKKNACEWQHPDENQTLSL